ncbi:hypothetical protein [Erysipelatoclostridium sp. An15]|uniref:hypothetical protein n=1 Tax=Erysipelatoclostridium sp. An15 TaxID=1965566 RepID=UPI000B38A58B|nr:hypothetical protein [Erysipelatoclostridium sp. An15]
MGATENDVALFIAYSKHYLYKDCLRILLHNHCPIITITSSSTGILYKYSNYHIFLHFRPPSSVGHKHTIKILIYH